MSRKKDQRRQESNKQQLIPKNTRVCHKKIRDDSTAGGRAETNTPQDVPRPENEKMEEGGSKLRYFKIFKRIS